MPWHCILIMRLIGLVLLLTNNLVAMFDVKYSQIKKKKNNVYIELSKIRVRSLKVSETIANLTLCRISVIQCPNIFPGMYTYPIMLLQTY